MLRTGFIGWLLSSIIKFTFILMIISLVMYISYLIGFYDVAGASIDSMVGIDEIASNFIGGDYALTSYEFLEPFGVYGQLIGAVIETCSKFNTVDPSSVTNLQELAFNCMSSTIMSAIVVSTVVKLYSSFSRNINKKFKMSPVLNFLTDFIIILVIVYISLISAACINRRVLILTQGTSYILRFIIYLAILLITSTFLAFIHKKSGGKSFFRKFLNVFVEALYNVLIAVSGLAAVSIMTILRSYGSTPIFTEEYGLLWFMLIVFIAFILICAYLAEKRKN